MEVSIPLAFLAGLASFLSPCVFALVPAYVGYLSGRAVALVPGRAASNRWETLTHGLAFVMGFSVVFIFLGIPATSRGAKLLENRDWLAKNWGVI